MNVALSISDGEPLECEHMFRASNFAVLDQLDLLPHLDFDDEARLGNVCAMITRARIFETSAKNSDDLDARYGRIRKTMATRAARRSS